MAFSNEAIGYPVWILVTRNAFFLLSQIKPEAYLFNVFVLIICALSLIYFCFLL